MILTSYVRILEYALHHRLKVVFLSFCSLVVLIEVWLLVIGIEKPIEFFPSLDPKGAYINVYPPEGSNLDYKDNILKKIEINIKSTDPIGEEDTDAILESHYFSRYKLQEHEKVTGEKFLGPTDINNIEYISSTSKK